MKYMVLLVSIFIVKPIFAGCGDKDGRCLIISDGKEREVDCSVTVCANVYSYLSRWELDSGPSVSIDYRDDVETVTIDSKKGYVIPSSILKNELTCVAVTESKNVYCAKDIPM